MCIRDSDEDRRPGRHPALPRAAQLPRPQRSPHPGDLQRRQTPPPGQRGPDRADLPAPAHPATTAGPGPPTHPSKHLQLIPKVGGHIDIEKCGTSDPRPLLAGDSDAAPSLLCQFQSQWWAELKRSLAQMDADPTWEPLVELKEANN